MHQHIDLSDHPIQFVREIRQRYGSKLQLYFSRYTYTRESRLESRESFPIRISRIDDHWLLDQFRTLNPWEEFAFESRVRTGRTLAHIPMLDFVGMSEGQLAAIMEVFPNYNTEDTSVYFSGRSFHAYFPMMISPREWIKFMGSALLCNKPTRQVVDQRWVGHRLISGYGALRWSWNTNTYKGMPRRIQSNVLNMPATFKRKLVKELPVRTGESVPT
jgi:hypothetical protein